MSFAVNILELVTGIEIIKTFTRPVINGLVNGLTAMWGMGELMHLRHHLVLGQ